LARPLPCFPTTTATMTTMAVITATASTATATSVRRGLTRESSASSCWPGSCATSCCTAGRQRL
jgi:hypothetical protein